MAPETGPLDVLTIGEMAIDFISVDKIVDFISHEMAHSLRTADQYSRYLGGQPANVAGYVAKLGGRSAIVTKLGFNYFGEDIEDQLQHHGVNTEAVNLTNEAATTNAFVTRTVSIPDFQANRGADALLAVRQVDEEMISRASIVHTSAFAHEVASLKLRVEGHVERMIDHESLYAGLKSAGQRTT